MDIKINDSVFTINEQECYTVLELIRKLVMPQLSQNTSDIENINSEIETINTSVSVIPSLTEGLTNVTNKANQNSQNINSLNVSIQALNSNKYDNVTISDDTLSFYANNSLKKQITLPTSGGGGSDNVTTGESDVKIGYSTDLGNTITEVDTLTAQYIKVGNFCYIYIPFTTIEQSGTTSTTWHIELPFEPAEKQFTQVGTATTTTVLAGYWMVNSYNNTITLNKTNYYQTSTEYYRGNLGGPALNSFISGGYFTKY